jgi:hypothetical protein
MSRAVGSGFLLPAGRLRRGIETVVCIGAGGVVALFCCQPWRCAMIRTIVLALAVLAGLSGAVLVSAGVTAQPAAACNPHTT